MAVSLKKARDFVYANGVLWERALFGFLFEDRPLAHLHQALLSYKNPDCGWGHALEHDIRTPDSHPLSLEYLLSILRITQVPIRTLLDGTPAWVEANQNPDGSLKNPPSVLDYPHAPWWNEGGQSIPDSIVGNLIGLGMASPALAENTRKWVQTNLPLEKVKANEWLFMAYHAHDYFFHVNDFPDVETYRAATLANIIECAEKMPDKQYSVIFYFAMWPNGTVSKGIPQHLIDRSLDYLMDTQAEDGSWEDEHGLLHWFPYVTICNLLALRNYSRITIP